MWTRSITEPVSPEDYLETAKALMRFIDTRKEAGPEGVFWSLRDASEGRKEYYDEICMYAGASGILCYLLALWDVTKEEAYLEEARKAGAYVCYRWEHDRSLKRNFSRYAFSSGWSGAGYALTRLYEAAGDERYRECVFSIAEQILKDAQPGPDGAGYVWSTYPGIVGNAGTILFLLYAAETYGCDRWKRFAAEAGKAILASGRDMGQGRRYYSGVDPRYFGGGADYADPNFPMGTAGIGYTLLRLYEASGDETFLEAVKGIPEYMESVAASAGRGRLLPHALPDRPNLFYLGYCHGPAGTCRFYYKLWKVTGDPEYARRMDRLAEGLAFAGAPELRSPGYWNTYNLCCGTAGILNLYLGLWAERGDGESLAMARRCGRVLLGGAYRVQTADGPAAEVPFALDRVDPRRISSPVGLFDGAAGIGAALLQLYLAEKGDFRTARLIDDPFPERRG
ncbi:MAG: lanthionine synthetase LanC family protein [Eubacteriales bacterium]|nr:lanthionine synthetase LanC family protein [Eubacteriales bacterium]